MPRYRVSPSGWGGHRSVTAALDAAASARHAVIEIEPGTYREQFVVRGNVELVCAGAPGSVIITSQYGATVETRGDVRLSGLRVIADNGEAIRCESGSLVVENSYAQALEVSLYGTPGTSVTLRDSGFHVGRVVFTGSSGLVERCRFTDGANNGIAVFNGSEVRIQQCHVANSRIHGIRVSAARAQIVGCTLTGIGNDAITADARADMTVSDCRITDTQRGGVAFIENSTGVLEKTSVDKAQHGVAVVSGANPVVRSCTFTACWDTGINVHTQGRGRFEDCSVISAGNIGIFSKDDGAPVVTTAVLHGGNVGIALDRGRGRFEGVRILEHTNLGIRLMNSAGGTFADIDVEGCPNGVESTGDGDTKSEFTGLTVRNSRTTGVSVAGSSRLTVRDSVATGGLVGFGVGDKAQLVLIDCRVEDVGTTGVVAFGQSSLRAERLTVSGTTEVGLGGSGHALVEITDSRFLELKTGGLILSESCTGKVADCAITGSQGTAVIHNGKVLLTGLRTSLPIKEVEDDPPPQVVNNYGLVFNAAVSGVQLAWNNQGPVAQHQSNAPSFEVGTGVPGWRASFKRLHASLGLGTATSLVEKHGPGVVQHVPDWVLCGVLDHPPVAVTDAVWDALHNVGAAVPDAAAALGLPVGAVGSSVDDQARLVELRGGTWGSGRLVRADETWSWEPVPAIRTEVSESALNWADGTPALRVRVIARLPWAQRFSLRPAGDLLAALPHSRFHRWFPADATWLPGTRPEVFSCATTGGQNMEGEVILALTDSAVVTCAETRLVRPAADPLTWAGFAGYFAAAWEMATEVLPNLLTPDPALSRWTAPPTVELRMTTPSSLESSADFTVFTEAHRPADMAVMITAPPRLTADSRQTLTREALLHLLHAHSFHSATESIFT